MQTTTRQSSSSSSAEAAGVRRELFLPRHLLERIPPYYVWTWGCDQCAASPCDRDICATEASARLSARRHNRLFHAELESVDA